MGANGRVGLTIVGQVVGSYFGPIGAMVGGMIGSAIGSALWPEQFEGPKLEGLQVTGSAYGGPIPKVYGAIRMGGNIIWASEIRETARTERQGKGGGPEITSYTYALDFAVGLCAGPVLGVRRIWADQKLIYDTGAGGDITAIYNSFSRVGSAMRVYTGTTTQLPDPTIEAALGVGATPAFRDLCYITFENFQLAEFGNRVPNITVEVIGGGTELGPRQLFGRDWNLPYEVNTRAAKSVRILGADGELGAQSLTGQGYVSALDGTDSRAGSLRTLGAWPINAPTGHETTATLLIWPQDGEESNGPIYVKQMPSGNTPASIATALIDRSLSNGGSFKQYQGTLSDGDNFIVALVPCVDNAHVLSLLAPVSTTTYPSYWVLYRHDIVLDAFVEVRRGTLSVPDVSTTFYRSGGAQTSLSAGVPIWYVGMLEADLKHFWQTTTASQQETRCYVLDGTVMRRIFTVDASPPAQDFDPCSIYADHSCCWVEAAGNIYGFTRSPGVALDVTLDEVVSDICLEAGLTAGDIDVTALASVPVRGYLRTPRMSARAAIEPLMTSYGFDAVESDLKLKFVLRAATPAASVPSGDLGAGDDQGDGVLVRTERAQESELPIAIDITYLAADADYNLGTQSFRRQVSASLDVQSIRLPLALTDAEAASIAARMVYELWTARNRREWATTIKWAKLEPCDVVDVAGSTATYRVRITQKRERSNLVQWEGLDVDAAAFSPLNAAQTVPPPQQVVRIAGKSAYLAADLPPLRELDFGKTGYYGAACGLSTPWPGAVIYRRPDGGSEFAPELSVLTPAVIGSTREALGQWGQTVEGRETFNGYSPDLVNSVTVAVASGSLSSCTHAEFLQLKNVALIGNEIVAFRDVQLISGNLYRISCLLRGLLGTEWYAALAPATAPASFVVNGDGTFTTNYIGFVDGHRVDDRFVVLSAAALQRFTPDSDSAPVGGTTRAITAGGALTGGSFATLEQTWASIVPPHPVHVTAYKDASAGLVVNFSRRTFVGGGWLSGREVGLDTAHKEFAVRLTNPSTGVQNSYIVSGDPPFTLGAATIAATVAGATVIWVQVAETSRLYPGIGSVDVIGIPTFKGARHWSRQRAVTW
jgi:hypothetical protein